MANFASVIKYFPTPKEGFITTLGSSILSGAVTVPLNSTSGLTNGDVFVGLIEPGLTNQQCFTGTVDTAGNQITGVVYTTGTNVAHSAGVTIVDYVTSTTVGMISKGVLKHANQDGSLTNAAVKAALGITADPTGSWNLLDGGAPTVSSVTANGNRSYTINFASDYSTTLSPGMRLRTTRTVAAPTQCTSLNGTSQYYNDTSVSGMTFTDDFTVSAWVKLSSYPANRAPIVQRADGTSANGWVLDINSTGNVRLLGYNGGIGNVSYVYSSQAVPINKWVHVSALLDMSAYSALAATAETAKSWITIDSVEVPAAVARAGTNPTTLVNTGDLQIGKSYTTEYFPGKIAQVAIYSTRVLQATIRASANQALTGSETSLISAYSFNNSINDLNTTNANNLTANGSAVATNADSCFGYQADGTISSTLDYAIITKVATTAVTVQVPEGCTIPTTGGVAGVSYATAKTPYGFPGAKGKWRIYVFGTVAMVGVIGGTLSWYGATGSAMKITIPIGQWTFGYMLNVSLDSTVSGARSGQFTLATSSATASLIGDLTARIFYPSSTPAAVFALSKNTEIELSTATSYEPFVYLYSSTGAETFNIVGPQGAAVVYADNSYL